MPTKITLSSKDKKEIAVNVMQQLQTILNGNFEGNETLSLKIPQLETTPCKQKPKIIISTTAGLKMTELVKNCSKEVGWHGFVERTDAYTFIIKDIVVYPQTVTGTTVNTDETEYALWLSTISTPDLKTMRFQGHSHVNMSCTPSATDTDLYNKYLSALHDDEYYIFFICNKRGDINAFLYDLKTNTKYITKDIEIIKETDMAPWFDSIKDQIKEYKPQTTVTHIPQSNVVRTNMLDGYGIYDEYYFQRAERDYSADSFDDSWDNRVKKANKKSKK